MPSSDTDDDIWSISDRAKSQSKSSSKASTPAAKKPKAGTKQSKASSKAQNKSASTSKTASKEKGTTTRSKKRAAETESGSRKRPKVEEDGQPPSSDVEPPQSSQQRSIRRWILPGVNMTETKAEKEPPAVPRRRSFSLRQKEPPSVSTAELESDNMLWLDKYVPQKEEEVAVHKKKIADVRNWLLKAISSAAERRRHVYPVAKILVLTGPSGAGKTAVVGMLAIELHLELLEWINPMNTNSITSVYAEEEDQLNRANGTSSYMSVSRKFSEFLGQAGRGPTLSMTTDASANAPSRSTGKIILVEDLPNVTNLPTREAVHSSIRAYAHSPRSTYPLIFIVSDTTIVNGSDGFNTRGSRADEMITIKHLIPPDILQSPVCSQINFNPIAPTILVKALTNVIKLESGNRTLKPSQTDKAQIERIAASSSGDIRCALNALQFLSLQSDRFWAVDTTGKEKGQKRKADDIGKDDGYG
ncbi:Cell cycle checkpoint protein rad17 [Rhizophlyctis rosea]|nr:Cell cycle checkpoint protein rad17 [Rhizophlyctis rosea]